MKKSSIIFCVISLLVSFLIAFLVFPMVSMTDEEMIKARTPKSAEEFESFDLGEFGLVSVIEMLEYYLSTPPQEEGAGGEGRKKNQGC